MPTSSGSRLLSVVQQASSLLLRPTSARAFSSARTGQMAALPASVSPAVPHIAKNAGGRVEGSRVSRQAPALLGPSSIRAFSTARTTQLSASVCRGIPQPGNSGGGWGSNTFTLSPLTRTNPTSRPTSLLQVSTPGLTPARGRAQIYYRPSAWKRVNKHGIERRLQSPGGIAVLWRRYLKKRHVLTPFDRMVPGTYGGQILPQHHLKYNRHLVSREVRKRMDEALRRKKC